MPKTNQLMVNTGRVRDHWHTMTRTGKSPRLSQHIAEPFCEINPEDAMRLGVRTADLVKMENARGSVIVARLGDGAPAAGPCLCADALERFLCRRCADWETGF